MDEQTELVLGLGGNDSDNSDDDGTPLKITQVEEQIAGCKADHLHQATMLALGLGGMEDSDSGTDVEEFVGEAEPITNKDLADAEPDDDDSDKETAAESGATEDEEAPVRKGASFGRGRPKRGGRGRGRGRGRGAGSKRRRVSEPAGPSAEGAPGPEPAEHAEPSAGGAPGPQAAEPAELAERVLTVGGYLLSALGLPRAAWPLTQPRGAANYTLADASGRRIEVQLKTRCFRVREKASSAATLFSWAKCGGVLAAWSKAGGDNFVAVA